MLLTRFYWSDKKGEVEIGESCLPYVREFKLIQDFGWKA